ncbi:MAG: bifunctional serine/threonine-protein kinase/formylglycine-generating enzyme family protein [Cellvibrio sp.]
MALQIPGYRIIRKINQGGMSTVYLAIQISVGRIVALKVMNPGLTSDPAFSERFQREATIVGQLSHPNIVAIYDIGRKEDLNYIAMDYLPGGSVHDKMINGLTGEEALRVTKEVANALDHAHEKGYIHRDIKPENILFRADNSAVLSDFGVAKGIVGVSRMTHVGTVVGTPHYMSPEQTRGQTVDARSDLYSLGVVFFEMLTGALPYQGEDAVTIALKHISAPIPKLPLQYQAYQRILEKFLAKDPNQRFQSGREISAAIDQLENATRVPYITNSAPEDLSIMALIRALFSATASAISWRWKKLTNLRWTNAEGFHYKKTTHDSVFGSEVAPTVFGARVHQQTHINTLLVFNNRNIRKLISILAVLVFLWCVLSVTVQSAFSTHANNWPQFLNSATRATANIFLPDESQENAVFVSNASSQAASQSSVQTSADTTPAVAVANTNSSEQASSQVSAIISQQSSSESSSLAPAAPTYALTIDTVPNDARIRLLNVPDRSKDGVELASGRYRIEVSKNGYKTKTDWIEIKGEPLKVNIELDVDLDAENISTKTITQASVSGGKNAPALVRIASGSYIMGDDSNMHTAPAHKVTINRAFAISKYEITFAEYDIYAQATNKPLPGDNGWGRDNRPVIHVSWEDANAYAQWLSKTTGKKFRLPTEAEWEYAARAGSTDIFWWGNNEQDAKGKANCRRGCLSNFSGLFGSKTAPVGNYSPNAFGLYDTAGNVSEWVQDCYSDNYSNVSSNGSAYEEKQCQARVVRGGSTKDNVQRLITSARDTFPPATMTETLGFRLVMELN